MKSVENIENMEGNLLNNKKIKKIVFLVIFLVLIFLIFLSIPCFSKNDFAKDNYSRAIYSVSDDEFLLYKNLDKKIHPASMTKIATSIHAIEQLGLDKKITVKPLMFNIPNNYVLLPTIVGEEISIKDLLYATLLKSSNDAACLLMQDIYDSPEAFEKGINDFLKKVGCHSTHFKTPYGLADPEHYTTPRDLIILANYAMKNPDFKEIVSKSKYTIPATNLSGKRVVVSTYEHSFLHKARGFVGIKTGFTEDAYNCFITQGTLDDKDYIFISTGNKIREDMIENVSKMYDKLKIYNEIKENSDKLMLNTNENEFKNSFQGFLQKFSLYIFENFRVCISSIHILLYTFILLVLIFFFLKSRRKRKRKRKAKSNRRFKKNKEKKKDKSRRKRKSKSKGRNRYR